MDWLLLSVTVQSQSFLNPYFSTKYASILQRSLIFYINNTLMLSIQVLVDFGKVKYVRTIYSNVTHRWTFWNSDIDFRLTLRGCTYLNIHPMKHTRPRSAVGNMSDYRCVSDCRSRDREFYPGPFPYFRGDWSWNDFYGHSPPFRWFIQEGLLSVTSESMCTNYWLTACSSLPRKKCG